MGDEKYKRIFFALWPDQSMRKQISHAFRASPFAEKHQYAYKSSNLHMTLHFLGNVDKSQFECVRDQAALITFKPFELQLDHFGSFGRARVLWLGPQTIPSGLQQLHDKLGQALSDCDVGLELREYRPHITLMRKFKQRLELEKIEPVNWWVDCFALVESVATPTGVAYTPLKFYS